MGSSRCSPLLSSSRTQAMCRLHRLLRELIPGGAPRQLSAEKAFDLLDDLKPDDPANAMRLVIAIDHIEDVMRLDRKIDDYNRRIVTEIKTSATTVTRVYEIGPINAAVILGEVGDVSRFPSRRAGRPKSLSISMDAPDVRLATRRVVGTIEPDVAHDGA